MKPFLGLILVCISAALFSLSNAIVKWLTELDAFTIAFLRFLIILALTIPSALFLKFKKNVPLFPKGVRIALILRSVLSSANLVILFYALKHLPLADANLIAGKVKCYTTRTVLSNPVAIYHIL
jgi:drug/metabolite transporter (DMT)-like permease